jgi:dCMP deaminase
MTLDDTALIARAWQERSRSKVSKGKVGACINTHRGLFIIGACNGTQPHQQEHGCAVLGCNVYENIHFASCRHVVHAELNAILECASRGYTTRGATMYCTHSPCWRCAQAIVGAGIKRFVYSTNYRLMDGYNYLHDNGIAVVQVGRPHVS